MFTSMVLIFLGTTLTGVGVYDRIGHYAGAGSIVPITGFANSVAAPALEFRREGMILGLGAKLFTLARTRSRLWNQRIGAGWIHLLDSERMAAMKSTNFSWRDFFRRAATYRFLGRGAR